MAYTSALGADAERRGGSSPLPGTIIKNPRGKNVAGYVFMVI
jgi:hypothetical protein